MIIFLGLGGYYGKFQVLGVVMSLGLGDILVIFEVSRVFLVNLVVLKYFRVGWFVEMILGS